MVTVSCHQTNDKKDLATININTTNSYSIGYHDKTNVLDLLC